MNAMILNADNDNNDGGAAGTLLPGPVLEPAMVWFYRLGRVRGMRVEATRLMDEACQRSTARLDELMECTEPLSGKGPTRERLWHTIQELNAVSLTASVLAEDLEEERIRRVLAEDMLGFALEGPEEDRLLAVEFFKRVRIARVLAREEGVASLAAQGRGPDGKLLGMGADAGKGGFEA